MRARILLATASTLLVFSASAQDSPAGLEQRLAELVEEFATGVDGVSVVVAVGDDVLFETGAGYSDVASRQSARADSRYRAAALVAPLTSLATSRLIEAGELALDDPLTKFFPELTFEGAEVLVGHLLDQTSGLASYLDWSDVRQEDTSLDSAAIVTWVAGQPLEAEPGRCAAWSPTNTLLAGMIVERIVGRPLADHLGTEVFEALGLEQTSFVEQGVPVRTAVHASWEFAGSEARDAHVAPPFGAARLCSSAMDLVRLQRALVTRELVGEETWRRIIEPELLADGSRPGHSNGINHTSLEGVEGLSFGGGFGGAWMHAAHYRAFDLTIAVAAIGEDARVVAIEQRLAREVLELPGEGIVDLELEPAQLEPYLGDFYLGCTRAQVLAREGQVWVGIAGESEFRLRAQGRHTFVSADDDQVRLVFEVEGGRAASFLYVVHGAESRARRVMQ